MPTRFLNTKHEQLFSDPPLRSPSAEELATRDLIRGLKEQIIQLEEALKRTRNDLQEQCHLLYRQRAERAPIRWVPDDILIYIFALGSTDALFPKSLPNFRESTPQEFPSRCLPFQIKVSYICSHWRRLAINTPSLWSTLAMERPPMPQGSPFDLWYSRSHESPMSLFLTRVVSSHDPSELAAYLPLLANASHRLAHLGIVGEERSCSTLLRTLSGKIARLESLHLSVFLDEANSQDEEGSGDDAVSDGRYLKAPRLISLRLSHSFNFASKTLSFALLQWLEICQAIPVSNGSLHRILAACSSLHYLRLSGHCFGPVPPRGEQNTTCLPALATLDYERECSAAKYAWLPCFRLPALKNVTAGASECEAPRFGEEIGLVNQLAVELEGRSANALFFHNLPAVSTLTLHYDAVCQLPHSRGLGHTLHLLRHGALPSLRVLNVRNTCATEGFGDSWPNGIARAFCRLPSARAQIGLPPLLVSTSPRLPTSSSVSRAAPADRQYQRTDEDDGQDLPLCLEEDEIHRVSDGPRPSNDVTSTYIHDWTPSYGRAMDRLDKQPKNTRPVDWSWWEKELFGEGGELCIELGSWEAELQAYVEGVPFIARRDARRAGKKYFKSGW